MADQSVNVKKTLNVALPDVYDTVSYDNGNQDGLTFCGARTYSVISPDPLPSFIQFSDRTLAVRTNTEDDVGVYPIEVEVSIGAIKRMSSFTLTVNPCQVPYFFIMLPGDKDYIIGDPEKSLGTIRNTQGGCAHNVTYELLVEDDAI